MNKIIKNLLKEHWILTEYGLYRKDAGSIHLHLYHGCFKEIPLTSDTIPSIIEVSYNSRCQTDALMSVLNELAAQCNSLIPNITFTFIPENSMVNELLDKLKESHFYPSADNFTFSYIPEIYFDSGEPISEELVQSYKDTIRPLTVQDSILTIYGPRDSHAIHLFYTAFYTQTQNALNNRCKSTGEKIMVKNYLDTFYLVTDSDPKSPEQSSDVLIDEIGNELKKFIKK